ncbi:amidohydrolase family protein [Oceanomicrobium pacificus]|uniref:Amidohydrolase family protein n=1 Tax=Oceanomicrobium pacificus TaxID=2692916 RepID=A0A6B0TR66_9RHOB|nr:amidohydrolase [Oceanomicrobium pacificus]MXU65189.1 amidohydrolase family protein [Oceanomicrobium pacificus]
MLFDTHLHLVYPDRLRYPWLDDAPALNRPSLMSDYARAAHRLGITDVLHMEVDVAPAQIREETALVSDLMAERGSLLRGAISSCRPEEDGFADLLDWAQDQPAIKGFRRILHEMPDDLSTTPTFRDNVKRLSGTGLTFDLCVYPRQHGHAVALIDHCPDVQFVLDHCGVPDIAAGGFDAWAPGITEIAKRSNVVAKISGIVAYTDRDAWTLDDLRPYVAHVARQFGHDRLIWGSDSPVCNLGGGLETWVGATHALTVDWLPGDRAALYAGNAKRLWSL